MKTKVANKDRMRMRMSKSQVINILSNKYMIDREWAQRQTISELFDLYKMLTQKLAHG